MSSLGKILAAHPLDEEPYNLITFTRVNGTGTPLYRVGADARELGAVEALRSAIKQFGGRCFRCGKKMKPQPMSQDVTRDHVRPKSDGGQDYLHNLVFACGRCNRSKGNVDLISFRPTRGLHYMRALDGHLVRCLERLRQE
jgi:hypothetical protein